MSENLAATNVQVGVAFDNQMLTLMRLILASSGLLVIYIDPAEPNRFVAVTYTLLALYTLYSAALHILAVRRSPVMDWVRAWSHWVDVGWYTVLIALSSGTNSLFFFGFFYAILIASFRWGFITGMSVAITSGVLFTAVGLIFTPTGMEFELNRFLLRPISLLVLGYMIAYRGEFEIDLKKRLTLLKEITKLSNPRFGIDQTVVTVLERVRAYYKADACLFIMADQTADHYTLYQASGPDRTRGEQTDILPPQLARQFLTLPDTHALTYRCADEWRWRKYYAFVVDTGRSLRDGREIGEDLAAKLDAHSFITVPVIFHGEFRGRLFVKAQRFLKSWEVEFLLQIIEHFMPMLDNVRLVDRLASDAAEIERQRIARDIHDSVIQPYLGLQIGLAAYRKKFGERGDAMTADLDRLSELVALGLGDLRAYVSALRHGGTGKESILEAIKRFAAKFAEATRISVRVDCPSELRLNDRLAAEVFQIIAEGLSNVRRHTQAKHVKIYLAAADNHLKLRIENERDEHTPFVPFNPRSIAGRAEALGGRTSVAQNEAGDTVVSVQIHL